MARGYAPNAGDCRVRKAIRKGVVAPDELE